MSGGHGESLVVLGPDGGLSSLGGASGRPQASFRGSLLPLYDSSSAAVMRAGRRAGTEGVHGEEEQGHREDGVEDFVAGHRVGRAVSSRVDGDGVGE